MLALDGRRRYRQYLGSRVITESWLAHRLDAPDLVAVSQCVDLRQNFQIRSSIRGTSAPAHHHHCCRRRHYARLRRLRRQDLDSPY